MNAQLSAPAAERTARPASTCDRQTEDLVRAHLPLVGHIVREVLGRVPSYVRRDELVSAGMYALTLSAASFDDSRGVPFARFAALRIRGAITDELRSMDWASRGVRSKAREIETARNDLTRTFGRTPTNGEIAQAVGFEAAEVDAVDADVQRASVLSLQALTVDGEHGSLPQSSDSPESLLLKREQIGYLHDAIAELPERLRAVVTQYFFEQRKMSRDRRRPRRHRVARLAAALRSPGAALRRLPGRLRRRAGGYGRPQPRPRRRGTQRVRGRGRVEVDAGHSARRHERVRRAAGDRRPAPAPGDLTHPQISRPER